MPEVRNDISPVDLQLVKELPSWQIRNGNAIVLVFFIAVVTICFFGRYPVWVPINLNFKSEKGGLIVIGETDYANKRDLKMGQVVSISILSDDKMKPFKFIGKITSEKRFSDSICSYEIKISRESNSTINQLITTGKISSRYGLVDVGSDNILTKIFGNLLSNKKSQLN